MKFVKTIYIKSNSGNRAVDALRNILTLLLFPIILVVGLVVMFLVGLLSFWQRLTTSKKEQQLETENEAKRLELQKQWSVFTTVNNLVINNQFGGSLPWDSGNYFYLKSEPKISYLDNKIFGDWFYTEFDCVFLQQWNDTTGSSCDLIFIDTISLRVFELMNDIPSRWWTAKKLDTEAVEFNFTTAQYESAFILDLQEIDNKRLASN